MKKVIFRYWLRDGVTDSCRDQAWLGIRAIPIGGMDSTLRYDLVNYSERLERRTNTAFGKEGLVKLVKAIAYFEEIESGQFPKDINISIY